MRKALLDQLMVEGKLLAYACDGFVLANTAALELAPSRRLHDYMDRLRSERLEVSCRLIEQHIAKIEDERAMLALMNGRFAIPR